MGGFIWKNLSPAPAMWKSKSSETAREASFIWENGIVPFNADTRKCSKRRLRPWHPPKSGMRMSEAALKIGRAIQYENAGTVEYILDQDSGQFYFLEMNTRIQVEHPVTEMTTGIDLVKEQIRVAAGDPLSLSQSDLRISGHAIECRITAESTREGFRPFPGRITAWRLSLEPGIRVDTHCYPGYLVPPYYDSLLAKVISFGRDRQEAVERMQSALGNFLCPVWRQPFPFTALS